MTHTPSSRPCWLWPPSPLVSLPCTSTSPSPQARSFPTILRSRTGQAYPGFPQLGGLPSCKCWLCCQPWGGAVGGQSEGVSVCSAEHVVIFSQAMDNLPPVPCPQLLIRRDMGVCHLSQGCPGALHQPGVGHIVSCHVLAPQPPWPPACCPLANLAEAQLHSSCPRRPDAFVEGTGCTQGQGFFSKFCI